jgi:outer membrane receptor for ferrienterochelin and colicins
MQKILILLLAAMFIYNAKAQHSFRAIVKNADTKEVLPAVTVQFTGANITSTTGNDGLVTITDIPAGKQSARFSHAGYKEQERSFTFPLTDTAVIEILMEAAEELEEVIIQSTRTSRTINNTPTRVETIDGEELDEKNNMRPANVSMLLHESTGLQVQQTSATSGNASIRVQGLDGRYTQLLKDGYPNFGNFAAGLSVWKFRRWTCGRWK